MNYNVRVVGDDFKNVRKGRTAYIIEARYHISRYVNPVTAILGYWYNTLLCRNIKSAALLWLETIRNLNISSDPTRERFLMEMAHIAGKSITVSIKHYFGTSGLFHIRFTWILIITAISSREWRFRYSFCEISSFGCNGCLCMVFS